MGDYETKVTKPHPHIAPMIYNELKGFNYGPADIKKFLQSEHATHMANRIVAIYRDSILDGSGKDKDAVKTARSFYLNYKRHH